MTHPKPARRQKLWSVRMRASGPKGEHISGAEGIFSPSRVQSAVEAFALRGLSHPKGRPSEITITVERMRKAPVAITALPARTLLCKNPKEAEDIIRLLLSMSAISLKAINAALKIVRSPGRMRGAALVCAQSGRRLDPDKKRGIRASMLGITPSSRASLMRKLSALGPSAETALEAITLASKVASAHGVIAELCVSDDPDYTTGYVASLKAGYLRIPNIKPPGSKSGGRVFFIAPETDISRVTAYLEETPVMVTRIAPVSLAPVRLQSLPLRLVGGRDISPD